MGRSPNFQPSLFDCLSSSEEGAPALPASAVADVRAAPPCEAPVDNGPAALDPLLPQDPSEPAWPPSNPASPANSSADVEDPIVQRSGINDGAVQAEEVSGTGSAEPPRRKRGRPPGSRNKRASWTSTSTAAIGQALLSAPTSAGSLESFVRFLSVQQVAARYSVSVASIWRWVALGKFPHPCKQTSGTSRWAIANLEAYERDLERSR